MQKNKFDIAELKHYNHIHMIGIGGISMSGIAEILNNWGFLVTGSDTSKSDITDKLIGNHIQVTIGHDLKMIHHADLVVHSAAIKQNDPELCEAKNLKIPTIERGEFLGIITKSYLDTIGISGTHGKTTTTSMVSLCFVEACFDPTIQVGAILKQLNGNYRIGNSNYFILEACEYAESFLKFHLKSQIVLNIDNDHLDYFGSFENIKKSFTKSVEKLPSAGFLILNADDTNCLDLKNFSKATSITYSLENKVADFTTKNITFDSNGFGSFDVYKKGEFYEHIELSVIGKHNISNSLACIALCDCYHLPKEAIKNALKNFTGAHRRFEYIGEHNGFFVYDDYGHHPTEILATATAVKQKHCHESWVIFQPHTYSRTKSLLTDFAQVLTNFDHIIVTDIYAARETNTYNISSEDLVAQIETLGKEVHYIPDFQEIVSHIKQHAKPNDLVLTLGAGSISTIGNLIVD